MTFRALTLRRHFPIRFRRWRFERIFRRFLCVHLSRQWKPAAWWHKFSGLANLGALHSTYFVRHNGLLIQSTLKSEGRRKVFLGKNRPQANSTFLDNLSSGKIQLTLLGKEWRNWSRPEFFCFWGYRRLWPQTRKKLSTARTHLQKHDTYLHGQKSQVRIPFLTGLYPIFLTYKWSLTVFILTYPLTLSTSAYLGA